MPLALEALASKTEIITTCPAFNIFYKVMRKDVLNMHLGVSMSTELKFFKPIYAVIKPGSGPLRSAECSL